jgi:hypothetical protein
MKQPKCSIPPCKKVATGYFHCWRCCRKCYVSLVKKQRAKANKELKEAKQ